MSTLRNIAAAFGIAAALGVGALGIGAGTANAAPVFASVQSGWGHGGYGGYGYHGYHGYHGYGGYGGYGYRGYHGYGYGGYAPPCVIGPLGFVHVCA